MNRKRLIEALQAQGYKGALTLDAAKAYFGTLLASGIIFSSGGKNLDEAGFEAAWAKTATVTLTDPDEEDETEPGETGGKAGTDPDQATLDAAERIRHKRAKALRGGDTSVGEVTRKAGEGPQTFSIGNAERKAFNAKAARGETFLPDADTAEVFGAALRMACMQGKGAYAALNRDIEIYNHFFGTGGDGKAVASDVFASGGFAVPAVLSNMFIDIKDSYGLLNTLVPSIPVPIQSMSIPRRASGITIGSTSQGIAVTVATEAQGDQVTLTPISYDCAVAVNQQALMASQINLAEFQIREMVYAQIKKEEEIYFNGDGTSTYLNQVGLLGKFQQLVVAAGGTWASNAAYASSVHAASSATWASITAADIDAWLSKIGLFEEMGDMEITCSRQFYGQVLNRLKRAGGGNDTNTMSASSSTTWDGWKVNFTNALPKIGGTANIVCAYAGSFKQASKRGVVPNSANITTDDSIYFLQRQRAIMMSQYAALTVHDLGTANSTAASRTGFGPVAALTTP